MSARRSAAAFALLLLLAAAGAAADGGARAWDFEVRLDDKPIGSHRFTLDEEAGGERALRSQADFEVRFLGFVAYRYHHEDRETWRGDCLVSMDANTDDDGKATRVKESAATLPGCPMSFAYWHPALRERRPTQLLNAQTGRVETVRIERLPDAAMPGAADGRPMQHWRISGAEAPIELWYAADGGDWLGLDSTVRGGRQLQYRRK